MKEYRTEAIRNIALVSHLSAGKTMLAEAFLHVSGGISRLGRIEDGTTTSDFDEEEIRRVCKCARLFRAAAGKRYSYRQLLLEKCRRNCRPVGNT